MPDNSRYLAERTFVLRVLGFYHQLIPLETVGPIEPDLGGNLLYAGELDGGGGALVVASNIAGAASLSATANVEAQKQAVRDGVVDFLVTSLDEALRILKNEIRKRTPVAVCVSAPPGDIELEMNDRGVTPDLGRPLEESPVPGFRDAAPGSAWNSANALIIWNVSTAPVQWMPKLDSVALACLVDGYSGVRRWLRHAPRYLGRLAQGTRAVCADREFAARFVEAAKGLEVVQVPMRIEVSYEGGSEEFKFRAPLIP